ncbi:MAG: carbonate dehydratase [Gammaproteobacteria bacterium]|nr:MAG: carbonate dehydratase [Gammaproteobacteria bacterium]RLA53131.1 MAG: carbonate dehydratase [Gammaproteobacteria bacterium]
MSELKHLLESNRQWAAERLATNPQFFSGLSQQQTPEYLWIGCSDSRVPANQIIDLPPGEVFVHRNIANVVVHTDLNCLSVVQYAVEVLKVKHIIVCGHYGCGGVQAAMENKEHGLIDNWLQHIRDVYRYYRAEIDACADNNEKLDRLCEKNVIQQVLNVCGSTVIQNAWANNEALSVHGWIYSIKDGLLRDLGISMSQVDDYRAANR